MFHLVSITLQLKVVEIEKNKTLENQGFQAEEEGIEPPLTVLETAALPLYYSSIILM